MPSSSYQPRTQQNKIFVAFIPGFRGICWAL
nr:MAG TPA: hypothetical protein [Caudoviricetes sp.]